MMTLVDTYSVHNSILAALPHEEYQVVSPWLEPVKYETGTIIALSEEPLEHFYFVTSGIVSLTVSTSYGESIEAAMVGREGAIGLCMLFGQQTGAMNKEVLGKSVHLLRIPVSKIKELQNQTSNLRSLLLYYLFKQMRQISQNIVCCNFHSLEQQLCKWLLLREDRMNGALYVTQDRIAQMLGVRRAGINQALQRLQRNGLLVCRRGSIEVKVRGEIEARACSCYQVIESNMWMDKYIER